MTTPTLISRPRNDAEGKPDETTEVSATRVDPLDRAATQIAEFVEQLPEVPDEVILLRGRLADIKKRATDMIAELDERVMVPMVKARGEIVVAPGVKWVMKLDKTIKPKFLRNAIEGLFLAVGGDFDAFVHCLSVNAVKPGEARKALGDKFDEFFETTVKEDVELKQPKKVLALVNENFVK